MQKSDCLFCRLVRGEIPSAKIYEDEHVYAFLDIGPLAPGHALVVPKAHCENLFDFDAAQAAPLLEALQKVGRAVMQATGATGMNVIQNNFADGGQSVFHLHWHLVPRHAGDRLLPWPATAYPSPAVMQEMASAVANAVTGAVPRQPEMD